MARCGCGTPHLCSPLARTVTCTNKNKNMATPNCKQGWKMRANCALQKKRRIWVPIFATPYLLFGLWKNLFPSSPLPNQGDSTVCSEVALGSLSQSGWCPITLQRRTPPFLLQLNGTEQILDVSQKVFKLYWRNKQSDLSGTIHMSVASISFLEPVIQGTQVSENLIYTAFSFDQGMFWSYLCK